VVNILDYIFKKKSISNDFCDEIIEKHKNLNWKNHVWYNPTDEKFIKHNEKELDIVYLEESFISEFIKKISLVVKEYNGLHSMNYENAHGSLINKISKPRINKYLPNTFMRMHYDHIYSLFDGKEKGIPVLSILTSLNDDYEGGEFIICDKKFILKKGETIIFPSLFMFPHKVDLVTKGIRYSIICWGY